MADFYVKNPLNPFKAARFGLTYQQVVDKNSKDGEHIWVIEISTSELGMAGEKLSPVYINEFNVNNLNSIIEEAVSALASKINWGVLLPDNDPPFIFSCLPASYLTNIHTRVSIRLKDLHPSYGIDFDNLQLLINGIDVSDEVKINGDIYDCLVEWAPKITIYEQEQVEL